MSLRWVVDASVAVRLFVPLPFSEKALALFDQLATMDSAEFHVPDVFYSEVLSALRRHERHASDYAQLETDLTLLVGFPLVVMPCRQLALAAAHISREHVVSTYDAFYLALSFLIGAPLITADDRLVRGVAGKGFDVRSLAEM
jgi:predicted nucleic acid-binding protein